jgi:hypothetical protein
LRVSERNCYNIKIITVGGRVRAEKLTAAVREAATM